MAVKNKDESYKRQQSKVSLPLLHTKWGLFPITVLTFSLVFLVSSTIPVERNLAEDIVASLEESTSLSMLEVFGYGLLSSLIMMIPIFGFIFSMFLSSVNGMAASAISVITNSNPLDIAVNYISNTGVILEFLAFGLASAQGLAGFFAIVEKRVRKELKEYLTTVLIVIGLLLAAISLEVFQTTVYP